MAQRSFLAPLRRWRRGLTGALESAFGAVGRRRDPLGFAALTGSWIGGTANMVAMAESVGTPDSLMGPIIVVDTVVGYGWMGILLFFSGWQQRWDRRINARTEALEETNRRLAAAETKSGPAAASRGLAWPFGAAVVS